MEQLGAEGVKVCGRVCNNGAENEISEHGLWQRDSGAVYVDGQREKKDQKERSILIELVLPFCVLGC